MEGDVKLTKQQMQELKDQSNKAIFPDIKQAVAEFEALIVWTTG